MRARALAERRNRVVLGSCHNQHGAVLLARERSDEELEADREGERLVRLLAAERHELLGLRAPSSTSPCVTAPIDTSVTSGSPSLDGTAIASGFVPVSGCPPLGCGNRRGEVAVSAATSPPAASRRTQ